MHGSPEAGFVVEASGSNRALTEHEIELLNEWYAKVVEYNIAHQQSKKYYGRIRMLFTSVMVFGPALANMCVKSNVPYNLTVALILTILASLAVAADARVHPAETAERHHVAHMKFRSLENKIKGLMNYSTVRSPGVAITIIRKKYDEVLVSVPIIPSWVIENVKRTRKVGTLRAMQIPMPEESPEQPGMFNQDELMILQTRMEMCRANRLKVVSVAEMYHCVCALVGGFTAAAAVLSTSLMFAAFIEGAPWWCQLFGSISNYTLCILTAIDGKAGFAAYTNKLQDITTRWSALAREIREALATQPHSNPHVLTATLESKCKAFVDEILADGLETVFISQHELSKQTTTCCPCCPCCRPTPTPDLQSDDSDAPLTRGSRPGIA